MNNAKSLCFPGQQDVNDVPIEDLCRLLRVENEAGMVPPQDSYNAQTQTGGVAAHQVGRLQQQLCFHQTQLIQKLQEVHSKAGDVIT